MEIIDVLKYPRLQLLLDFQTRNGGIIDLHNDYSCYQVEITATEIKFLFELEKPTEDYTPRGVIPKVTLRIKNYSTDGKLSFSDEELPRSLDNLSIGSNGHLIVLSFIDGGEYHLTAEQVTLEF